jgi:hypothetical protein
MAVRHVLLHGHMFKNAGSTLDWALARSFGDAFVDHRDDQPMRREGAPYLAAYLGDHPTTRALSSHHLCYPLPEQAGLELHTVALLRHPLDRVLSVYHFERRQAAATPGAINAKRWGLARYVEWRLTPEAGATIRNFQTRFLSGKLGRPRQPVDEDDWQTARHRLDEIAVGLVDEFDTSMVLFEKRLRPVFPELDLAHVPQNVGQRSRDRDPGAELYEELGAGLFDALLSANQYDFMLYETARAVLHARRRSIEGFADCLAEYRSRCARLVDAA